MASFPAINERCLCSQFQFWWASLYTAESNLRDAACISKQNCNCFLQSRCSMFQIEISIILSVVISFGCFLKRIFVLKGLLKISSSFLVVLHSSVSLSLWHFHLNSPHCLSYLLCDVVWNHYHIFHQKQNNSKLIFFFFLFFFPLLSFKKSAVNRFCSIQESNVYFPGHPEVHFVPWHKAGSSLPVVLDWELTVSSCPVLNLGSAVLFLALKSK